MAELSGEERARILCRLRELQSRFQHEPGVGQNELPREVDPETLLANYLRVMGELDTETCIERRRILKALAITLRKQWADLRGADSVHEIAFGTPI